ncbi:hypothetical protein [Streptomyces sp. NPDC014685]|uniref:hypothetical protein n=1 Tax=Streptomyces sp. NPDC014685 TaxID=3364881 RepID=UPI0036FD27F1
MSVTEGGRELCGVDRTSIRKVHFIPLSPGPHLLQLDVLRTRKKRSTRVEREVVLDQGDVLLVTCDPVQPNVFYRRSPVADTWSLQIIRYGIVVEGVRAMRKIKHPLLMLALLAAGIVAVRQGVQEVGGIWADIIPPAFAMGMAGIIGNYLRKRPDPTHGPEEGSDAWNG